VQHSLDAGNAGLAARRKDAQGVGAKTTGKLKPWQNRDLLQEPAIFRQFFSFVFL
jgi:hypothetical protein